MGRIDADHLLAAGGEKRGEGPCAAADVQNRLSAEFIHQSDIGIEVRPVMVQRVEDLSKSGYLKMRVCHGSDSRRSNAYGEVVGTLGRSTMDARVARMRLRRSVRALLVLARETTTAACGNPTAVKQWYVVATVDNPRAPLSPSATATLQALANGTFGLVG
jgi:hypothetical protein